MKILAWGLKDKSEKFHENMREEPEVLIVEDSEEMLWMMGNVLDSAGFVVEAVTTGGEALEKVREFREIGLVIINYLLPDMTGVSVIEQLRRNGFGGEVIGTSALKEARDSFTRAGVFAFLEKPFDINELIGLCHQAISTGNA